jgi:hypothetical protein
VIDLAASGAYRLLLGPVDLRGSATPTPRLARRDVAPTTLVIESVMLCYCPTTPSPSQVTSKWGCELVACTRKVPSLAGGCDLGQPHSSSSGGLLRPQDPTIKPRAKSRG